MLFKAVVLFCAISCIQAQNCKENGTIYAMKKPTYDFSIKFLDRISYGLTRHFVYSPISTWLQLILVADGAKDKTLREIFEVTGLNNYRKRTCYRNTLKQIVNKMKDDSVTRNSVVIIDKFYKVEKLFQNKVESLKDVKILTLDFEDAQNSADKANTFVQNGNDFTSIPPFIDTDFNNRVILMTDVTYFKSAWKHPFNVAQTRTTPFLSESGYRKIGEVEMMNQVGYFKTFQFPSIDARVLELPFANERFSMLIYLPTAENVSHIFYTLKKTSLSTIMYRLNKEKASAIQVSLPKFVIETEVASIPALLFDMGVRRAFYPESASLKGITKSGDVNVSWMSQIAKINVTETHVEAAATSELAENIIRDNVKSFNVNRPFAFMLVDKITEFILFAGIYSNPNERHQSYQY